MALHEVPFTSTNGRDEIQAWIHVPATAPKGVVQLIHGLGEHSRRYTHLISALLDAGFVVAADDHAGHGRTAMKSGVWQDAGQDAATVVVEDEQVLRTKVVELLGDLPYIVFGHSWGSMIARCLAVTYPQGLVGLVVCGPVAQMKGLEDPATARNLAAAVAEHGGQALDTQGLGAAMFAGFNDRYGQVSTPTAWVALDEAVVADHAADPYNNFGAPMTLRFALGFTDLYTRSYGPQWASRVPTDLPVLIIAGENSP